MEYNKVFSSQLFLGGEAIDLEKVNKQAVRKRDPGEKLFYLLILKGGKR
jgi:hypothetical protein